MPSQIDTGVFQGDPLKGAFHACGTVRRPVGHEPLHGLIPRTFVVRYREPSAIDVRIAILST